MHRGIVWMEFASTLTDPEETTVKIHHHPHELKREEILALAQEAKLMYVDSGMPFLNDMATDKELIVFARLLEAHHMKKETA